MSNSRLLEPSADYFKNPCLLELRKNAIEVDLRVPGNDLKFPFPPSYFARFDSVPVRKPKNIYIAARKPTVTVVNELIVNLESRGGFPADFPKIIMCPRVNSP